MRLKLHPNNQTFAAVKNANNSFVDKSNRRMRTPKDTSTLVKRHPRQQQLSPCCRLFLSPVYSHSRYVHQAVNYCYWRTLKGHVVTSDWSRYLFIVQHPRATCILLHYHASEKQLSWSSPPNPSRYRGNHLSSKSEVRFCLFDEPPAHNTESQTALQKRKSSFSELVYMPMEQSIYNANHSTPGNAQIEYPSMPSYTQTRLQ